MAKSLQVANKSENSMDFGAWDLVIPNSAQQAYIQNKMTLKELKKELKSMTIPNQLTIGAKNFNNVQKTIDSHIRYLESNKGNKAFMPYWYNLLEIYEFVKVQPKKK